MEEKRGMQQGKNHTVSKADNRNSSIELLRILSMLMIVGSHFATHGGFSFDSQSITVPRLWWNVIEMGGHFGVDVFVIISGYFLIENKSLAFNLKRVLKFWGQVFFYSVLLFAFSFIIGQGSFSPKVIIKMLFPITFSEWWFASTYFVLYLLHPYINRLLHTFDKKQYQGFLIMLLIFWSVIPTLTSSSYQSNALLEFVLFYSIAGYIKTWGLNPGLKSKHYFGLWVIFTFLTYLSCVILMILGTKYTVFSSHSLFFYGRTKIPTLLRAISFFMAFATMKMAYHKWINKIASAAFGVYLLHDSNLLRSYLWKDVFKNALFQNSKYIIIYSIGVVILVYVICTLIDLIRQTVFEKPFLKVVDRFSAQWMRPFEIACKKLQAVIFGGE